MLRNALRVTGCLLVIGAVLAASQAYAAMYIDARVGTASTSTSLVIHRSDLYDGGGNPKNLDVTLYIYARVQGTSTTSVSQGMQYAKYDILSNQSGLGLNGTTKGAVTGGLVDTTQSLGSNWTAASSYAGTVQDANGDGIKDLGTTATSRTANSDFVYARSATMLSGGSTGNAAATNTGWEWQLETVTMRITGANVGTGTTQFVPTVPAWAGAGLNTGEGYKQDTINYTSSNWKQGTSVAFTLAPTTLTASLTNQGSDGKYHVSLGGSVTLGGAATITDGFGSPSQYGWDLTGDGVPDVTSTTSSTTVTYNYLVNTLHLAQGDHAVTLKITTNDGAMGADPGGTLNIVPEPATVALLVTGGIAIAARRRRHKDV